MNDIPQIAVTMGDPAGVGPEICLRLLAEPSLAGVVNPVVFGSIAVMERVAEKLALPFSGTRLSGARVADGLETVKGPAVLDLEVGDLSGIVPGRVQAEAGEAAYRYVLAAIEAGLGGLVDGIATGPLNKAALHAAGHRFPGHTEIFAERMAAERSCMMLTSDVLTCSFVTVHVGYHEVPQLLSVPRILEVIELTREAMRRIREREPRLLICGLNPHAGENGLFGRREEETLIFPAVEQARAQGIEIDGPVPPDTAFLPARREAYDAVVCLYHDQGHIPLKALAFDRAINTTLGLPVVRTSVDHGTAFDIAWQGKASPNSLLEAVRLAARLAHEGSAGLSG